MIKPLILASILSLSGCASLFDKEPTIDRVRTEYVYQGIPDKLFKCDPPLEFTREELEEITTEFEMNRQVTIPNFARHAVCFRTINNIRALNERLEQQSNNVISKATKHDN